MSGCQSLYSDMCMRHFGACHNHHPPGEQQLLCLLARATMAAHVVTPAWHMHTWNTPLKLGTEETTKNTYLFF